MKSMHNIGFIDGQNLYLWTQADGWTVDLFKLRRFLRDKFHVDTAYYFLWYLDDDQQDLYDRLQKAWFVIVFREHSAALLGKKKWNVDVDIVFSMMRHLVEYDTTRDKIVLVSGDGDYKRVVDYLIKKSVFARIIFPNRNHSSLYKKLGNKYYYYLHNAYNKIAFHH